MRACVALLIQLVISNKYLALRARAYLAYLLTDQRTLAPAYEREILPGDPERENS